jgi:hypothetical protein
MGSYTLTHPTETIAVSAWSAGVYVLRLEAKGQVYLRKVVIL